MHELRSFKDHPIIFGVSLSRPHPADLAPRVLPVTLYEARRLDRPEYEPTDGSCGASLPCFERQRERGSGPPLSTLNQELMQPNITHLVVPIIL